MGGAAGAAGAGAGAGASAGASAGAGAAGGGGFMSGFKNMFSGGGGDMMKTMGNVQQGMQMGQQAGQGVSDAMSGSGGINDEGESADAGGMPVGTSNENLQGKNYPEGSYVNDEGMLVDANGNPIDYDMEAQNNDAMNQFNNIADEKDKNKKVWGDAIKGITNPNADLVGSATNMITAGIDYYNAQKDEVNKLRRANSMDAFAFL
jgi:hypothetical protein